MAGQAGTRDLKVTSPHLFPVQTSRLCHLSPQESSIPAAHKRSKSFQTRPTRWGLGHSTWVLRTTLPETPRRAPTSALLTAHAPLPHAIHKAFSSENTRPGLPPPTGPALAVHLGHPSHFSQLRALPHPEGEKGTSCPRAKE